MNRTQRVLAVITLAALTVITTSAPADYFCGLYCDGSQCAGPALPDSFCGQNTFLGKSVCSDTTSCICTGTCGGGGGGGGDCFDDPECLDNELP
jgi:hypothetical protein